MCLLPGIYYFYHESSVVGIKVKAYPYDLEELHILKVADIDVLTVRRIKEILIVLTHR